VLYNTLGDSNIKSVLHMKEVKSGMEGDIGVRSQWNVLNNYTAWAYDNKNEGVLESQGRMVCLLWNFCNEKF
jgi:hypothetical protein